MTVIDPIVLNVLRAAEVEGCALTLAGQLDRDLYVKTNKVLEALGGKWNRKQKAHLFDGPAEERLEQVLETGQYVNARVELGLFQTPLTVAEEAASRLALDECGAKPLVLEPSAGKGALIGAVLRRRPDARIAAVEIDPRHKPDLQIVNTQVVIQDFLTLSPPSPMYERIIMNPPFGRQADIRHVLYAWEWLERGGRLVAIMSAGWTFRTNNLSRQFQQFVDDNGEYEPLPEGAFKSSGTGVRTVLVTLDK